MCESLLVTVTRTNNKAKIACPWKKNRFSMFFLLVFLLEIARFDCAVSRKRAFPPFNSNHFHVHCLSKRQHSLCSFSWARNFASSSSTLLHLKQNEMNYVWHISNETNTNHQENMINSNWNEMYYNTFNRAEANNKKKKKKKSKFRSSDQMTEEIECTNTMIS